MIGNAYFMRLPEHGAYIVARSGHKHKLYSFLLAFFLQSRIVFKVCMFLETHNQCLRQLFSRVSWMLA